MRKIAFLAFLLTISSWGFTQPFQTFLKNVEIIPEKERQGSVDSYLQKNPLAPYTESDSVCFFIYVGEAKTVEVAGDFSHWKPTLHMKRVEATNLWYASCFFQKDSRVDYKIVVNGENWILDPMNPNLCPSGFGPNSELRMPAWKPVPEVLFNPDIPHGTILSYTIHSTVLNNTRAYKVYLPPTYDSLKGSYPLLLFHDGLEYLSLAQAQNTLDYLIASKKIRPIIGLFVPPIDRYDEYNGKKKKEFAEFIIQELLPLIDLQFATNNSPTERGTIGASSGGNISLYLGTNYPEVFGKIAAQSSSVEEVVFKTVERSPKKNIRIYMDVGRYDIPEIIDWTERLATILEEKKYPLEYRRWNEGHSWGMWRDHLAEPLVFLFGE